MGGKRDGSGSERAREERRSSRTRVRLERACGRGNARGRGGRDEKCKVKQAGFRQRNTETRSIPSDPLIATFVKINDPPFSFVPIPETPAETYRIKSSISCSAARDEFSADQFAPGERTDSLMDRLRSLLSSVFRFRDPPRRTFLRAREFHCRAAIEACSVLRYSLASL